MISADLSTVPAGAWTALTAAITGLFAVFAAGLKYLMDVRKREQVLVDKVLSEVIPGQAANAEALRAATEMMSKFTQQLAIDQAVKDSEARQRSTPRKQ